MADLFATVLRPIAEQRGLETWEQLAAYAAEEWYPSRIAFGQHKGRSIAEARTDAGLRRWLEWLAQSVASTGLVLYVNPELQRLRALVDAARARLAELEAGFTIEKAKVEAMKARLFARWMASLRRAMPTTPQGPSF